MKTKSSPLTESITPKDDQLQVTNEGIFTRRCWTGLIIAKKGQGKSSLILSLLMTSKKKHGLLKAFDRIYLISPTASKDDKMDSLRDECEMQGTFYPEFDNDIMGEILEDLEGYNEAWAASKKKRKPHILVIFDDCLASLPKNTKRGQHFNKFMTCNRHLNASVLITTQRLNELSPLVRSQADIIMYFHSDNKQENQILEDTWNVSKAHLAEATREPHSFLTISYLGGGKPKYYHKFDEFEE